MQYAYHIENIMEIEKISDHIPIAKNNQMMSKSPSKKSLDKGVAADDVAATPRMGKLHSWAVRGLRNLRFLGGTKTGKEPLDIDSLFTKHAVDGTNGKLLFKDKFGVCIGMEDSKAFAEGLFEALARRYNIRPEDGISKEELDRFLIDLKNDDHDKQLHLFFDMCDKNGDGRLSQEEVKEVLVMSAKANKLPKVEKSAGKYAALIMEHLDSDQNGTIEMRELQSLMVGMMSFKGSGISDRGPDENRSFVRQILKKTTDKIQDNWKKIWILTLWLCINVGLFTWKVEQFKRRGAFEVMGYCVCFAKGAGETLKFNMAVILLPVCRRTLTRLRETFLSSFIPFDDNLDFHKIVAGGIGVGVFLHTVFHAGCNFVKLTTCPEDKFMRNLGHYFDFDQPSYLDLVRSTAGITGILMIILMAFIFTLAIQSVRKKEIKVPPLLDRFVGFNAFWYAHHLLILVYILLIIHGFFIFLTKEWYKKSTWMYIAIPVLGYACERIYTTYENPHEVEVQQAVVYTGNVLGLYMSKPENFNYKSGMYLFVKCPEISRLEWHPFSITSAPSENYLSVHIQATGDWTQELKERCFKADDSIRRIRKGSLLRMETKAYSDIEQSQSQTKYPKTMIKGPYGAPAQDYNKYDVLLLVGLGIGATPFISIVKDILNNEKLSCNNKSPAKRYPQRAYFYWVAREQKNFEWFRGVMDDIAEFDTNFVIDMHVHLTSIEEGAKTVLINMAQSLNLAKNGVNIVTENRIMTHFGRPNWKTVLTDIKSEHKSSEIGVFYCGKPAAAKDLITACEELSSDSGGTRFEFHKENF